MKNSIIRVTATIVLGLAIALGATGCGNDFSGRQVGDALWLLEGRSMFPVARNQVSCPSANSGDRIICRVEGHEVCIDVFPGANGAQVRRVARAIC